MRSVRYGCRRTRSHSPGPSGPRLSQIAFETPSRPKSCTRPARRSVAPRARAARAARPLGGELGDGARVAERVRRLQVDEVRDRQQRRVELLVGERDRERRLGVDHGVPGADRVEVGEQLGRLGVDEVAERRDRTGRRARSRASARAASTPPMRCATSTNSAELREPRGDRDRLARQLAGPALAVPLLVGRAERLEHLGGSSSCSPSERASAACWSIMPSTSRWPESANSSPTRKRCSGGLPGAEPPHARRPSCAAAQLVRRTCPP